MKLSLHPRTFLDAAVVGFLAVGLLTGATLSKDAAPQGRTELGTVPDFHPELGLGALRGYLNPKALPDSLALIPPPPVIGSPAFAHDVEVARATFGLRDTPRFALAVSDFDLRPSKLTDDFLDRVQQQLKSQTQTRRPPRRDARKRPDRSSAFPPQGSKTGLRVRSGRIWRVGQARSTAVTSTTADRADADFVRETI